MDLDQVEDEIRKAEQYLMQAKSDGSSDPNSKVKSKRLSSYGELPNRKKVTVRKTSLRKKERRKEILEGLRKETTEKKKNVEIFTSETPSISEFRDTKIHQSQIAPLPTNGDPHDLDADVEQVDCAEYLQDDGFLDQIAFGEDCNVYYASDLHKEPIPTQLDTTTLPTEMQHPHSDIPSSTQKPVREPDAVHFSRTDVHLQSFVDSNSHDISMQKTKGFIPEREREDSFLAAQQQLKQKQTQKPKEKQNERVVEYPHNELNSTQRSSSQRKPKYTIHPECTFKPEITPYAKKQVNYDSKNRIEELAKPRVGAYEMREKQRMEKEEEQVQRECSFHPTTNTKKKLSTKTNSNQGYANKPHLRGWVDSHAQEKEVAAQKTCDRLYEQGKNRYLIRQNAKEAVEEYEFQQFPFKPTINPSTDKFIDYIEYKPLHERVSLVQRRKMDRLRHIQQQVQKQETEVSPFVPKINDRSRRIAEIKFAQDYLSGNASKRGSSMVPEECDEAENDIYVREYMNHSGAPPSVTTRLVKDGEIGIVRKLKKQVEYDQEKSKELRFAPEINSISRQIVKEKPEFKMDFINRQQAFELRNNERLERKLAKEEQRMCCSARKNRVDLHPSSSSSHAQYSFSPDIGNTDEWLMTSKKQHVIHETQSERARRLSFHEKREIELKRKAISQSYYNQFTFQPTINPISKELGEKSSIHELSKSKATRMKEKESNRKLFLEMEKKFQSECSFKPTLLTRKKERLSSPKYSSSLNLGDAKNVIRQIEDKRKRVERERSEKRREQEYEELKKCSFYPRTNNSSTRKQRATKRLSSKAHNEHRGANNGSVEGVRRPVIVRGLGRFLELQQMARSKHEEKREREDKLFYRTKIEITPKLINPTIPQPFKLSFMEGKHQKVHEGRKEHLSKEIQAKEMQECTFHPETMEGKNRRLIQKLLIQQKEDEKSLLDAENYYPTKVA